jgi:site-specific recombinase XerD
MLRDLITKEALLKALRKSGSELVQNTRSENTKKSYQSDFKKFAEWCLSVDLAALPADPDTVRLYLVFLDKIGRKSSTITRVITSIRQAHKLANFDSPISMSVSETAKALFRKLGVEKTKKSALTKDKLERILKFIGQDFLGIRDRAIILVGWTGALRRSEIVEINFEDIEQVAEGLIITIRRSKTDQMGKGRKIGLPFVDSDQNFCAARALQNWLTTSKIKSDSVFRQIGKGRKKIGERLDDKQISRVVKGYAKKAGYDPAVFGGHSLRSGLATTLASIGIEERKIMNITGHKSLPMLREYIQRGELFFEHPILTLFK